MSIEAQMRPITVLVASDCDVTARALGSVLETQGYAVDRVRTGHETLAAVRAGWPSAVIVDAEIPDMTGIELCRALRGEPQPAGATPVILVNGDGARRSDRLDAFGAGAWEVCPRPIDGTLLLLRLQTFVQARQPVEGLVSASLMDAETRVYNLAGLLLRAQELQALAARHRQPLACIAFMPEARTQPLAHPQLAAPNAPDIVRIGRGRLRASDVLGRVGPSEFAVLAPETDGDGAIQLLYRLQASLDDVRADWGGHACPLRVACSVVADCGEAGVSAAQSLLEVTRTLRESSRGPDRMAEAARMVVAGSSIGMPILS
jgi:PleD family two-component response regulator